MAGQPARLRPGACRRYLADEMAAVMSAAEPVDDEEASEPNREN